MSRLTVLIARSQALVGVVDLLRDWAALGVVGDLLAVAVDDLPAGLTIPAHRIYGLTAEAPARYERVRLSEALADAPEVDVLRVAVLDLPALAPQIDEGSALAARDLLARFLPQAKIIAAHVIAPQFSEAESGHGQSSAPRWHPEAGVWEGWHNIVVAPENASAPSGGVAPVLASPTSPVALTHPVAACCALLGLLAGHSASLLDERRYAPGRQAFVARSFTRFLTADALTQDVLVRATDVAERYPIPRYGKQVVVVDDEVAAAVEQADKLLTKHADVLPRERRQPQPRPPVKIGALQALGLFFRFFGAALRNAPRAFIHAMVRRTSAAIAREVAGFVFGPTDSAYTVVVGGIGTDGRPVNYADLDAALDDLAERVNPAGGGYRPENLSGLWQDFVAGGQTLLDAGSRVPELPPLEVGSQRAVVSATAAVAPGPTGFELSDALKPFLPGWRIAGADLALARRLDDRLADLSREQGHLTEQVARERRALAEWVASLGGYTGRVGRRLGDAMLATFSEIAALNDHLARTTAQAALPSNVDAGQSRLGRTLLTIAGVALALVICTVLLTVFVPLDWWIGVIICVVLILGWLIASVQAFMNHQRAIFAILHRREDDARLAGVLSQQLREAIADGRRLSRAYRQYLDWSSALGAFLHAPLGRAVERAGSELLVGPGLPRNVLIGTAVADPAVLNDAVDTLRRELFEAGWLRTGWEQFLAELPPGEGNWRFHVREQPDLLWSDPRIDASGSVLTDWSAAVVRHAPDRGVPSGFVQRLQQLLDADHAGATTALRQRVLLRRSETGEAATIDYGDFVAGLGSRDSGHVFDPALFATAPELIHPTAVTETIEQRVEHGINLSLVATQLSAGLRTADLASDANADHATDGAIDVATGSDQGSSTATRSTAPATPDVSHLPPV